MARICIVQHKLDRRAACVTAALRVTASLPRVLRKQTVVLCVKPDDDETRGCRGVVDTLAALHSLHRRAATAQSELWPSSIHAIQR